MIFNVKQRVLTLKLFFILVTAIVIMISSTIIFAESSIKVFVENTEIQFDVAPQIINGRTMLPLRAIFESLNASVIWDSKSSTVIAKKGDISVSLSINSTNATINGKIVTIDVPSMIVNGRTLVPVRFISEALGMNVDWNSKTSEITIKEKSSSLIKEVMVTSEKELQSAISSNTKIIINLDILKLKSNIKISNLENLTIEGKSDERVQVVEEDSSADVFVIENSKNITLRNLSIGHMYTGGCGGGVVTVNKCDTLKIENSLLFGCGTFGIYTKDSINISVIDSIIEKCSDKLIELYSSQNILFKNSSFRDSNTGNAVISINLCQNVDFNLCQIYENAYKSNDGEKGYIFDIQSSPQNSSLNLKLNLKDTRIYNNSKRIAFKNSDEVNIDNCKIQGMDNSESLTSGYLSTFTHSGDSRISLNPTPFLAPISLENKLRSLKEVTVKSGKEFVNAVSSNTKIIIDAEDIYIDSEETDLETPHAVYQDGTLTIKNVENLVITSKSRDGSKIIAEDMEVSVLQFENAKNVLIKNIMPVHMYYAFSKCGLKLKNCDTISIESCLFENCNSQIEVLGSKNITVIDSVIQKGNGSAISFQNTQKAILYNLIIKDQTLNNPIIYSDTSTGVEFITCQIYQNNYIHDVDGVAREGELISVYSFESDKTSDYKIKMINTKITKNKIRLVCRYPDMVIFENCNVQEDILGE